MISIIIILAVVVVCICIAATAIVDQLEEINKTLKNINKKDISC